MHRLRKSFYLFFLFFILLIPFVIRGDDSLSSKYKINLICYKNGFGLSQDITILERELSKLGHSVEFVNILDSKSPSKADINIFIEVAREDLFSFGNKNFFLPNPEWCRLSNEQIAQFDLILCKTKEGERIFKLLNPNTIYLGFTCHDHYDAKIAKDYKSILHLAGGSIQKGTDGLIRLWHQNPQFPSLYLIKRNGLTSYPTASNIIFINDYLPNTAISNFQNQCGLHICPSETEGFGYYIMEALSSGAVVITTNAPPMNEFVTDKRCLIDYHRTSSQFLATNYYIDPQKLEKVIANLLSLPEEELIKIGAKNRQFYLENDLQFKQKITQIFSSDFLLKSKHDWTEQVFTYIYQNKLWGESPSGEGSNPGNTTLYQCFLQNFLKDQQIKKVVDLDCGGWQFSQFIDWNGIHYTGFDVFKEMIEKNQANFSTPLIQFIHRNALRMNLPEADLLICKDVLQHLPNEEIHFLLPQLCKFKHCIIVNDVDPVNLTSHNDDISIGSYRYLDLTKPPFNLSGQKLLTFVSGGVTKQILYIKNNH